MGISQWSDLPLVLTTEQAATVLQIKRRTIANMLDRGDLRGVKIGKEWRVSRAELLRFVEGTVGGTEGSTASSLGAGPSLTDKGGVLVAQAEPREDLAGFIEREHEKRISEMIQKAGL